MAPYARRLALSLALVLAVTGVSCSPATQGPGGAGSGGSSSGSGGASGGRGGSSAAGGSGGSSSAGSGGSSTGTGGSSAGTGGSSSAGTGGSSSAGSGGSSAGTGGGGGSSSAGSGGSSAGSGGSASDGGTATEAAAGGDSGPSTGPLPMAMRKVVILHDANAGASAGDPSRKSMEDILKAMNGSHGITVTWMNSPTKASELMDAALVIVGPNSSMFGANHPDPGLKTLPVPLMVSKDGNTTEIGLGKVGATDPPNYNTISIIKTDHPLAAGLAMGTQTVLTTPSRQRIITFSGVGPDAIKIAAGPQSAASYAIIGYEKGGDMGGGVKAPARRVGFFWHRPAGTSPQGRKLFEAAVDWLLRSP